MGQHGDEPLIAAEQFALRREREDIEADKADALPQLLCIDCKYFAPPSGQNFANDVHAYGKCDHPHNLSVSPVDGSLQRTISDYAVTIRRQTQHCGPAAKWWRAK